MLRIIFVLMVVCLCLNAEPKISPLQEITLDNHIISTQLVGDNLYIGTDFGEVLKLKIGDKNPQLVVKLPNVASFFDDSYAPKVHSVDALGDKMAILGEGDFGSKDLYIFENNALKNLENLSSLSIKKVRFVDTNTIFLGLSSNEIMLYDLKAQKIMYKKQLSEASFADFELDLELGRYVLSCESGILYYGNIKDGSVIAELEGANKDNVYQVKMARDGDIVKLISAGQDRNIGIYTLDLKTLKTSTEILKADFLVYSVGLSKNGAVAAYMANEKSDIEVLDLQNLTPLYLLSGHKSLLNNIIFVNNNKIISSEDDKSILIWEF